MTTSGGRRHPRRRKYGAGCSGKAAYGSWEEAKAVNPNATPYPCESCGCFHLTTHPKVF